MFRAWLLVAVHLVWQVVCCLFFGGSWVFVLLALFFVAVLFAWELPRWVRALA